MRYEDSGLGPPSRRKYRRWWLCLGLASIVVGVLNQEIGGQIYGDYLHIVAGILGTSIAIFVMSGVLPWFWLAFVRPDKRNGPMIAWTLLLCLSAFATLSVAKFERAEGPLAPAGAAVHRFSPGGCEFAVEFPDQPKTTSVVVPQFGEFPEAEISGNQGLMRALCISVSDLGSSGVIPFYYDQQLLLNTLQAYAVQDGIGNVSFSHERTGLGIRAGARGTKQIDGRWLTYEVVSFVSTRSIMSLTTGHLSEGYPSRDISAFLGSVTRVKRAPAS